MQELFNISSRNSFAHTWLSEMPEGLGSFETFDALEYTINDFKKHGLKPQQVEGDLFKLAVGTTVVYWIERDSQVLLGVELKKKSEGLVVTMLGKFPPLRGKPPYASDLYSAILKDSEQNVRLLSDTQLSDEGLSVWKKLLGHGHKISVYDREAPGATFQTLETEADLDAFFKVDDTDFQRYQYVLSEGVEQFCALRASFTRRKLRESVPGMALSD